MSVLLWFDRKVRDWWPFLVSLAAAGLIVTLAVVGFVVVDERRYFEAEAARDRRQDAALTELLDAQRGADAHRAERLEEGLRLLEQLLADQFAAHDYNVAVKLNDLLAQIAHLLGRPAGVVQDPVHAVSDDPPPPPSAPADHRDPPPPPTTTTTAPSAPPSTTTTTSPGESGLCGRNPTIPLCRRR